MKRSINSFKLLPPLAKSYVFGCIGLSVGEHYSKSYERIGIKFYGGVMIFTIKNSLNFCGDEGLL